MPYVSPPVCLILMLQLGATMHNFLRVYFARALLEPPFDPLSSIYSRSVLAVYASACSIVKGIRLIYEKEPVAVMKYAFFWTQAFSSAAVLATIAIRAPDCPLAKPGMVEFGMYSVQIDRLFYSFSDSTLELFEREKANLRACGLVSSREMYLDYLSPFTADPSSSSSASTRVTGKI